MGAGDITIPAGSNISGPTFNSLTNTALATGFTIAGGTTSKTLTVPLDSSVSGTNTGDSATNSSSLSITGGSLTGAVTMTVDNTDNYIPLTITQNDTTNDPGAVVISNNADGIALSVGCGISTTTTGVNFNANGMTTGTVLKIYSNSLTSGYGADFQDNNASSNGTFIRMVKAGSGTNLLLDQNGNGLGLYIDKDCTVNNTRTWALQIDSDNAGTGTALGCGIDMSSFSVDEPVLKVVADAITVLGVIAGQIAIDVGGTTYYIPYMQHGT